ncbi:MAG: exo-alpha-sialidase [Firmicutes bacterium]|nr:exo-alpha-sialidase [Bacillota bacterium]
MIREITNHYDPGLKRPKLCTEQFVLWEPTADWGYAHHAQLVWFKGRYYCMFSSGRFNEDDTSQRIMITSSEDYTEWTAPQVLVDSRPGVYADAVLIPKTFVTDGNTLTAHLLTFEYTEDWLVGVNRKPGSKGRMNWGSLMTRTTDGVHWSDPEPAEFYGGNQKPRALQSGRLLSPGGVSHGITDDPTGLTGWRKVECCDRRYPNTDVPEDGDGTTSSGVVGNHTVGLCEADFVQIEDGTIWMLMRSGTNYLWASKSTDDGETWTLPEPTLFTDNRTKFALGRLPGGKYFYVGTPDPFPPRTRPVLALSLSDNGLDYTQHFLLDDTQYKGKFIGLDKNGIYGYPSVLVRDGYLHVVFSICKETIVALRVPCETL